MEERRHYSRVLFSVPATLNLNNKKWHTHLIDLSLQGALVECPRGWSDPNETIMQLSYSLCGDVIINMDVQQVGSVDQTLHLKCHSIDIESLAHLKRLVSLNMPNEDALNRELEHLVAE